MHDDARRAELRQLSRLLDERVDLAGGAGAVDEARLELALCLGDRLGRLAQVRDVVQRIVQPEDVDPVLRRGCDEAPRELAADGTRADEEPSAQRETERRLDARVDRADALPRALDAPAHCAVEDPSAGDLEVGEAGAIEDLGEPQHLRVRNPPRERLLPEQPDRGVDELRHQKGPYRRKDVRSTTVHGLRTVLFAAGILTPTISSTTNEPSSVARSGSSTSRTGPGSIGAST